MPQRRRAIIFLIIASVLWSLGGLLIKLVNWNAPAIAGMRSTITAIVLLVYLRRPHFHWSPAQIGGALAYTCTVILFVLAKKLTTAANAILLQYSAPIYVALFGAWFLNERATGLDWLTIIFVMGGMLLFFLDDLTGGNRWGNICAMPDAKGWIGLLLLGVFQLGLPYILYTAAIKHLAALEASLIPVLEALLNPLWVFLLVGETPGWWAVVGGMMVLGAVTARGILVAKIKAAPVSALVTAAKVIFPNKLKQFLRKQRIGAKGGVCENDGIDRHRISVGSSRC